MSVTISDIAARCNLSPGAVSQVLRDPDHPRFLPETRERILRAAREMNYVPNRLASQLRQGQTHLLSLVLPYNIPELMDVAERTAEQNGYAMMVQYTPTPSHAIQHRDLLAALERRVDGILWMASNCGSDHQQLIASMKQAGTWPVLLEAEPAHWPQVDVVGINTGQACRQAVGHLLEQGYAQLVHLTYEPVEGPRRICAEQFLAAAAQQGVEGRILCIDPSQDVSGQILTFISQRDDPGPVGFLCENDWVGIDLTRLLESTGLSIPDDAGVVIIGDLLLGDRFYLGELTRPKLTAVQRPYGQMAAKAVELLMRRIREKQSTPPQQILLDMQLIVRDSSVRARR